MNIYSTLFFRAPSFSGGPTDQFVVPVGFRAVVKDIRIVFGNVTISGVDAWVQTDDLTKLARYTWFTTMSSFTNNGGTAQWYGTQVVDEGEILQTQTVAGTVDISCSGFLLQKP